MRHWFTRSDLKLDQSVIKRFEPSQWTVEFPRPCMASVVSQPGAPALKVCVDFAHRGDMVGLVYASDDSAAHIGHQRHTNRDYSNCTLTFRWRSSRLVALDAVNGPVLTIEGRDEAGISRTWFVRLWNYAEGAPTDAVVRLPFDKLDAGFALPTDAARVWPKDIERMFFSLASDEFVEGSTEPVSGGLIGELEISAIDCTGSGSVVTMNDAFVPEHRYRICTAYDDLYHLTPERVIDAVERLGYRGLLNHYVGMSHYPALGSDGLVLAEEPLNEPARRWHESFASLAAERGYEIIWSVSMELLEQYCPGEWKQRSWDGRAAQTGYSPPSTLLSPAVEDAIEYLGNVAAAFVGIGKDTGLPPLLQIGEPWWWVQADGGICLYDEAAAAHWPEEHVPIHAISQLSGESDLVVLDRAGELLSEATLAIANRARLKDAELKTHILIYLPSVVRKDAPEAIRANMPLGWSAPAFDVLQLEDYEWASSGLVERCRSGQALATSRLQYGKDKQHYLAGYVAAHDARSEWHTIMDAAADAEALGVAEIFIWALPQVLRDDLTIFEGEEDVEAFRDVSFPLEIGRRAWVEPHFSTTISSTANGFEYRNADCAQARLRFDVGPGLRSLQDLRTLLHFFREMRGNATAFRFRDPTDFSTANMVESPSATDVSLGTGDGVTRRFPLIKSYGTGEVRRITRPEADTVIVSVDGVVTSGWTLSPGGVVEFHEPPAPSASIRAGFLFDVPVRFAEESLRVSHATHQAGEAVSVPLMEVREA